MTVIYVDERNIHIEVCKQRLVVPRHHLERNLGVKFSSCIAHSQEVLLDAVGERGLR